MRSPGPVWSRSIRVRLTLVYSLALFSLAAIVLAGVYTGLSRALDDEPITTRLVQNRLQPVDGGLVFTRQAFAVDMRTVESLANERALEQLRTWSFGSLGVLFLLSLGVGWVVAGRVVRPIARITDVAREIGATDLSRRIDLRGPDDELTRLAGTFDEMLGRLDRAFESQRRFVPEASHELRNPLATIRTNLEVALADPEADVEDLRHTAAVVDRSAERMGRVVDDLLAFARSEIPEHELVLVDLADVCAEVVAEFRSPAEAADVRLRLTGEPSHLVRGDPVALRRVIANLLANAVQHAPAGSEVLVRLGDAAGVGSTSMGAAVEVIDEGDGVEPMARERIFDRAWRGEAARTNRPSGSGLGLTIVRQVTNAHGGACWVTEADTATGRGARFVAAFPRPYR